MTWSLAFRLRDFGCRLLTDYCFEYVFRRALIARKARGFEDKLNMLFIKMVGFGKAHRDYDQWKIEAALMLEELASLRVRRHSNRRLPADDYLEWLYKEPFEPDPVKRTEFLISHPTEDAGGLRKCDAAQLASRLEILHRAVAAALSCGTSSFDNVLDEVSE